MKIRFAILSSECGYHPDLSSVCGNHPDLSNECGNHPDSKIFGRLELSVVLRTVPLKGFIADLRSETTKLSYTILY